MKVLRPFVLFLLLPLAALAAERALKVDKSRTFIDVDVDATFNFTAHLDDYEAKVTVDDSGKIKTASFAFKFTDLKTGKPERDEKMIAWLGGGTPDAHFELGTLAMTPDGQGQASGRLTFHGVTERVEFPINVVHADGAYTLTGETLLDYRTWNLKVIRTAMVLKVNPEVKVRFKLTGVSTDDGKK